jgi:hypothetical protein
MTDLALAGSDQKSGAALSASSTASASPRSATSKIPPHLADPALQVLDFLAQFFVHGRSVAVPAPSIKPQAAIRFLSWPKHSRRRYVY